MGRIAGILFLSIQEKENHEKGFSNKDEYINRRKGRYMGVDVCRKLTVRVKV